MYTIVGSGFGIYGYLPALVEGLGETVLLSRAYEEKVRSRPELAETLTAIRWADNEKTAISLARAVVVATTPKRQFEIVLRCLTLPHIEKLVLEKPIAVTPQLAVEVLEKLEEANKRYRIGFTLLHTNWHQEIEWPKFLASATEVTITWTFMAHHFSQQLTTWKRFHNKGGGVLRFYGIHLVALLAYHGYEGVRSSVLNGESPNQPERWEAVFSGSGLPDCRVHVDSRCDMKRFEIGQNFAQHEHVILKVIDPFQQETRIGDEDVRIGVLKRLLSTFNSDDHHFNLYYKRVIALWQKTEEAI